MSDRLLYTLSTRGCVRLEFFNELLEDVASTTPSSDAVPSFDIRPQLSRLLDALGHCEFDYEGRHVWACPPSLVTLPASGLYQAVLTGARTPSLETELKKAVKQRGADASMQRTQQVFGKATLPSVITLTAVSSDTLRGIAEACGLRWISEQPAAWRLAAFSTSHEQILSALSFSIRADLNWPRKTFSIEQLSFSRAANEAEYKLVMYKNPADQQLRHWLWDGASAAEIDRDWGRFLLLRRTGKNVILYDAKKHRACVPSTTSLPPLLARAITLCSGRAPVPYLLAANRLGLPASHPFHVYSGVPRHVAELIGQKLGQQLVAASCDEDEARLIPC